MMKKPYAALLLTGFFAAIVVTVLTYVVLRSAPVRVAEEPVETPPESGRLMAPEPGLSLYTDAARDFLLYYPDVVMPFTDPEEILTMGYIPVCDPETAVACFPYGQGEYKGTNFEAAAFAVHDRVDLKTEAACGEAGNGETAEGATTIGDAEFRTFVFGDAAAGHRLDGRNYRAFRDGRCVELSSRVGTSVYENWEPGAIREFTASDRAAVDAVLDRMLRSFRFQENIELI